MSSSGTPVARFRNHPGRAVAGLIVTLSLTTLLAVSGWFALLYLPSLAWTLWAWRAGTDVGPFGLRVRALLATRTVPWSQVDSLAATGPDQVVATLTNGAVLPLTGVTAGDLPRLAEWTASQPAPASQPIGIKAPKWF